MNIPADNEINNLINEILRTVFLIFPSGNFKFNPPSNKTKQTKSPTIVSSPCPRSSGSTSPKPERPMNNPEINKITTLGNPETEEIKRAHAPAKTVIPQSKPSLSGVINFSL